MLSADLVNKLTMLLSQYWQTSVDVQPIEKLDSQYIVVRCEVTGEHPDLPRNIIVKKWQLQGAASEFQALPTPERFYREHDSLQFLSTYLKEQDLAPRVIASDREAGLLILEDLGKHPTVQDVLFEKENSHSAKIVLEVARQLAHLHGASLGKSAEFEAITQGVEAMLVDAACDLSTPEFWEPLQASLEGMRAPQIDINELSQIETQLHIASDFYVLSHCDAGVHNFLAVDNHVRIMDFECARYANGFLDLACLRLGFPIAFHARRLPTNIIEKAETAYRRILSDYFPQAEDDEWFQSMMSAACTHWALVWMMNIWRGYLVERLKVGASYDLEGQRSPEIMGLFRQKCLTYLNVALETADAYHYRTSLHDSIASWRATFLQHFPETELLPYYPAFMS